MVFCLLTTAAVHADESQDVRPLFEPPPGARMHRDVEYGRPDGKPLHLDIYLPPTTSAEPLPVVVWMHGGAWIHGNKDRCPFAFLAGEGYAVVSINYRLADVAIFPAQIHDCKAAIRWIRGHAEKYGFDPTRIAATGGSAGGHLAALLGTSGGVAKLEPGRVLDLDNGRDTTTRHASSANREPATRPDATARFDAPASPDTPASRDDKRAAPANKQCPKYGTCVQAVVDFCGPTLFVPGEIPGNGDELDHPGLIKLLGGTVQERPKLARAASPMTYVSPDDPPFLIVHGDADPIVPVTQSEIFVAALREAGVPVKLHVVKGAGHAVLNPKTARMTKRWLDTHLKRNTTTRPTPKGNGD